MFILFAFISELGFSTFYIVLKLIKYIRYICHIKVSLRVEKKDYNILWIQWEASVENNIWIHYDRFIEYIFMTTELTVI